MLPRDLALLEHITCDIPRLKAFCAGRLADND